MSTDNGLDRLGHIRGHIGVLWDRREYLFEKIDSKKAADKNTGFEEREIEALDYALDVMEADWDSVARMRRNVQRIENRLGALERRGIQEDHGAPPEWETGPSKYVPHTLDVKVQGDRL